MYLNYVASRGETVHLTQRRGVANEDPVRCNLVSLASAAATPRLWLLNTVGEE
jgi:hypothetical protein